MLAVGAQYPVTDRSIIHDYIHSDMTVCISGRLPAAKGAPNRGAIHPRAQSHKYEPPPSAT